MKVSKKGGGDNGFTPRVVEIIVESQEELEALQFAYEELASDQIDHIGEINASIIVVLLDTIYEEAK